MNRTTKLPPIPELLCNLAQILDTVKDEWGTSWSKWDQEQRDAITQWQEILSGKRPFEWIAEPKCCCDVSTPCPIHGFETVWD